MIPSQHLARVASIHGVRTAKLSMIHPAPAMERQDTMAMTVLWVLSRALEVGAANASRGAMSNGIFIVADLCSRARCRLLRLA